jgi:hypothetical protein
MPHLKNMKVRLRLTQYNNMTATWNISLVSNAHRTSKYIGNIESGMKTNMKCILCDVECILFKVYKYDDNAH